MKFADIKAIAQNQKQNKKKQQTISNCTVLHGGDFNNFPKTKQMAIHERNVNRLRD